eukprot:gene24421-29288_t
MRDRSEFGRIGSAHPGMKPLCRSSPSKENHHGSVASQPP